MWIRSDFLSFFTNSLSIFALKMSSADSDDPYEANHTNNDENYVPEAGNRNHNPKNMEVLLENSSTCSSGGDNYEQPRTSASTPHRGKKRTRRKELWKRNLRKQQGTQGKAYGTVVCPQKIGGDCSCRNKCLEKIGAQGRQKIFDEFYSVSSKDHQDSYLYGLIKCKDVVRNRSRSGKGRQKLKSYAYMVRFKGQEQKICKKAFLSLHGITTHLNQQSGTPPIDRRGKHGSRINEISDEVNEKIRQHILSFPKYKFHYSRKDNLQHYYLSPLLNIAKMHEIYLQKNEPEQYQLLSQLLPINPVVKYEHFRKYFNENFKITFGKPKSDTYLKCDKLMNKISAADSEEQKKVLELEKSLHIAKSEAFYSDMKNKTELAKNNPAIEVLTFDYQQNLPLPVPSSGEVFYKIQLWIFNFCITVGSSSESYFYVCDETIAGKGQNDVISLLLHVFSNHIRQEVTDLYPFSENCSSQNKNNVLVHFMYILVELHKFRLICHRYPEPGHSILPCDRSFGAIELQKRKHDKIYLPRDYVNIIQSASKNFQIIAVDQGMFRNFKEHLQRFFVKNPSKKNKKFTISKYRLMKYEKTDEGTLFKCSESVSLQIFEPFDLKKPKDFGTHFNATCTEQAIFGAKEIEKE